MKLLFITQTLDRHDSVLGFVHGWIEEFAKHRHVENVIVICLGKGEFNLPSQVQVYSLGKEEGKGRWSFLKKFYTYIWKYRHEYDTVFVHMNQLYILLGGLLWRLLGKKIGLWYAHGYVSFSLRIAENITQYIFTSTESGFRLPSTKRYVVGQGIDTEHFKPERTRLRDNQRLHIMTVGRISPVKRYEVLIQAVEHLKGCGIMCRATIIGGVALREHESYYELLCQEVAQRSLSEEVVFTGPISNHAIREYLLQADVFVNMSLTGSLDKAILEAMACGVPVVTCNEALKGILIDDLAQWLYPPNDVDALAKKLTQLNAYSIEEQTALGSRLRSIVVADHNLIGLIAHIIDIYETKT